MQQIKRIKIKHGNTNLTATANVGIGSDHVNYFSFPLISPLWSKDNSYGVCGICSRFFMGSNAI